MPTSRREILNCILWSLGGAVLLVGLLLILAVADALGFFHDPPLRLEQTGSTVTAHVETLGDYQTTVGRKRIQESQSGKIVYESVVAQRAPQIFNFKLVDGENPTRLVGDDSDSYRVIEPRSGRTFTLQRGTRYRLTVWGDAWTFSRASFAF